MNNSSLTNPNESRPTFRFGEFSFDARRRILWRDSETVQIAPKAGELLGALLAHAPQVLSKEELMNLVWPDAFVEEANLTHHISALRRALGEDKNGRKFIETVPRKGYRFVADLRPAETGTAEITLTERVTVQTFQELEIDEDGLLPAPANNLLPVTGHSKTSTRSFSTVALIVIAGAFICAAIVYGGLKILSGNEKPGITPQNITFKRLTPDLDAVGAAISPDGKTAAFILMDKGRQSFRQKNLATGELAQLAPDYSLSEKICGFLQYAPDGQWLYYGCTGAQQFQPTLYRMPAAGGAAQKIAADVMSDYDLSPDGAQAAFIRDSKYLIVAATGGSGEERVAAQREGSGKSYFIQGLGHAPGWSPDGRHLALAAASNRQGRLIYELVDIDLTTGAEKILSSSPSLQFYEVRWLADGSGLIATASEGEGLPKRLNYVSYPDGKITLLTNDDHHYDTIRLTKDSRALIAQQNIGSFNLWLSPAGDFSQRKQITIGASAKHGIRGFTWTPNGKIIYTSTQSGALDLWQIDEDGGGAKQLTNNAGSVNILPQATADGRYIVFQSNRSGRDQIWRMDAGGGNPLQLTNGDLAWDPRLSADGLWVYYLTTTSGEKGDEVDKISIDGGEPAPLTDRQYLSAPRFSPDGRWMAFEARDPGGDSYFGLANLAGGRETRLPKLGEWLPDSKSMLVADGENRLQTLDIATGNLSPAADFQQNMILKFAFSPNNQKCVFALGSLTSEAVLIENYLGEAQPK